MSELGPELDEAGVAELAELAQRRGLVRLRAVSLDHPDLELAYRRLDSFLDAGRQGEMDFLARTRELRRDPARLLPGARSVLVALVPYAGEASPVARYAQFADYHTVIHRRWLAVLPELEARLPGLRALVCVDTKPLLERAFAQIAGLGFLGKHGCLIAPGLGSYVLIGCLLTNLKVPTPLPKVPVQAKEPPWSACGSCTRCLEACPSEAFVGPGELDPRRCVSYLTIEHRGPIADELMEKMGERVAGCDRCQEVCPYNAAVESRAGRVPLAAWLPAHTDARDREPELLRLLGLGNNQHRAFVRGSALNRIPRRSLRRNAAIALGHRLRAQARAAPSVAGAEEEALERACRSEDPQLAAAATWALRFRRRA